MHKSKRKWLCLDCGTHTGQAKEHYFLKPIVWLAIHASEKGMLCIGCAEARLGRQFNANDFTDAHINNPKKNAMSDRLRDRIVNG